MASSNVSIIVPTYNRARYLGECIESLLRQTRPALEILVIDDGSSDNTAELTTTFGSPVRYIRKDNGGKPSAVALGLAESQGEWIWILDDDDVAYPDAIERRLEALAANPAAGFVYAPHTLGADDLEGRISLGREYRPPEYEPERFCLELMKNCFFHLGTVLARRDLCVRLGGLDASLGAGEDYDFQIRLARIAHPVFCPYPAFIFRQHGGIRGATAEARYVGRGREAAFRKFSFAIGQKILTEFALGEFLVPPRSEALSTQETREALIARAHIMANNGCVAAMFADWTAAVASSAAVPQRPFSPKQLRAVSDAVLAGWAYEASALQWDEVVKMATRLSHQRGGREVVLAFAHGLLRLASGFPDSMAARIRKALRATRIASIALMVRA